MLFLTNIDLNKNELRNAKIHVLAAAPSSPQEGIIYYNSTDKTLNYYTGAAWITLGRLDQVSIPTAPVSLNSQKITSLATPTAAADAATKEYVDSLSAGLDPHASVRAATTVAGTLATSFENGDAIDGVTLATGDRILIKDQASAVENGIYTVNTSGVPTRAIDADVGAELSGGSFVFVEEGTVNADTGWVASHNGVPTIGVSAINFTQFSSAASLTAGNGLVKTGNTLDVVAGAGIIANADDIALTGQALALHNLATNGVIVRTGVDTVSGRTLTGTANLVTITNGDGVAGNPTFTVGSNVYQVGGTDVAVADGGTGASTAAAARTNLAATGKYTATIGDNSATTINITQATHGLASDGSMHAMVYDATSGAQVFPDISINNSNGTVSFIFTTAPTTSQFRIVLIG